jgi:hypothetical protein
LLIGESARSIFIRFENGAKQEPREKIVGFFRGDKRVIKFQRNQRVSL